MTIDFDVNKAAPPPDSPYVLVSVAEDQVDTSDSNRYTVSPIRTSGTQGIMLDLGNKMNQIDKDINDLKSGVVDLTKEQQWFKKAGYFVIAAAVVAGGWLFNQVGNIKDDVANVKIDFTKKLNESQMLLSQQISDSTEKILFEVKANKEQINELKLKLANNHPEMK